VFDPAERVRARSAGLLFQAMTLGVVAPPRPLRFELPGKVILQEAMRRHDECRRASALSFAGSH
jgi:hypothetical protein